MYRFYQIISPEKIKPNIHTIIDGIPCFEEEWEKRQFEPRAGVVGMKIGESASAQGSIFYLRCGPEIYVPVITSGVKEISYSQFSRLYWDNFGGRIKKGADSFAFSPAARVPIIQLS